MIGIYIRTSTLKQSKQYSPTVQRNGGIAFADNTGEKYSIYEESKSGGSLNRSKLQEMFDDISKGYINKVWVIEHTRISRDMEDSTYIAKFFLKNKCHLYIKGELVDLTDHRQRFFYHISSAVSEYERSEIKSRMQGGRNTSFDLGKRVLSRCYGYTHEWKDGKRKWIIDNEQADVVRMVYDLFINENYSMTKLITTLNDRGIGTFGGKYWSNKPMRALLTRKEYVGLTTDSKGNLIESKIYEPILEREIWEKSCSKVKLLHDEYNETHEKIRKTTGALTNIVKCGYCGMPYNFRHQKRTYKGVKKNSNYDREIYFHSPELSCDGQTPKIHHRHQIESAFEYAYLLTFMDTEARDGWIEKKQKEIAHFNANHKTDVSRLESKIKELNKRINNLVDALAMGVAVENIETKLKEAETEKIKLTESRDKLNRDYSATLMEYKDAEKYFFDDVVTQITDLSPEDKRRLYKTIVKSCIIRGKVMDVQFLFGKKISFEINQFQKDLAPVLREMAKDRKKNKTFKPDSYFMTGALLLILQTKDKRTVKEIIGKEDTTKGGHCFGFVYEKNSPFCKVNHNESKTITYIYKELSKGKSITELTYSLRKGKYKKKRGTYEWTRRDVRNIISKIQISGRWYDGKGRIIKSNRFPEIVQPHLFDKIYETYITERRKVD